MFKVTRGYVLAATETSPDISNDNIYPVYSSQTKNEGLMGYYSDYLYEDAITWTTDGANAGTVKFRKGKFYCTNVCGVLLSNEGIANKAVAEALNAVAWKYVSHVGNPKLMNNVMSEIEIMIPKSVEEQLKISEYLDTFDNLITLHQRKQSCNTLFINVWEQRKLGELSSSFEYGLNAAAKEYDGENKYIRITDIDDDSREFKQEDITSPDTDLSSAENYRLSEGDILFARTGASVGKSYIYKVSDGLVYYAGFLIRARIKPEYNSEFVFQNTLTSDYEKFIKVTSMRSGQPGVNAQEYSQYQIMVPSKPEQDKISECLRNLDHLITLHRRAYHYTKRRTYK